MKTQLERWCHQGKKTVAEYEVDFNQIVRFVPHVAHTEYEKARIFRQGLKASIRRVLGAFVLEDFRSVVERALGVEVHDDFTDELSGDRSQDQKGHTGGPTQKKVRIVIIILMVVVLLSLVLLELVLEVDLLNSGLSLSRDWD
jgi:hypothetical protein